MRTGAQCCVAILLLLSLWSVFSIADAGQHSQEDAAARAVQHQEQLQRMQNDILQQYLYIVKHPTGNPAEDTRRKLELLEQSRQLLQRQQAPPPPAPPLHERKP